MSFSRDLASLQDQILAYCESCKRGAARIPATWGHGQASSHTKTNDTTCPQPSHGSKSQFWSRRCCKSLLTLEIIYSLLSVHLGVNAFASKVLSLGTAPKDSDNSLACKCILTWVARGTKSFLPFSNFSACLLEVPLHLCRKCIKHRLTYETGNGTEGCILCTLIIAINLLRNNYI